MPLCSDIVKPLLVNWWHWKIIPIVTNYELKGITQRRAKHPDCQHSSKVPSWEPVKELNRCDDIDTCIKEL